MLFPADAFLSSGEVMGVTAVLIWVFFVFVMVAFSLAVPIIFAVIVHKDASKFPEAAWQASGQSKVLWVILTLFVTWIGLLIYFLAIKPKVQEVANYMAGVTPYWTGPQGMPPQGAPFQGGPPQGTF